MLITREDAAQGRFICRIWRACRIWIADGHDPKCAERTASSSGVLRAISAPVSSRYRIRPAELANWTGAGHYRASPSHFVRAQLWIVIFLGRAASGTGSVTVS